MAIQAVRVHEDSTIINLPDRNKTTTVKTLLREKKTFVYDAQSRLIYKSTEKQLDSSSYKIKYVKKRYNSSGILIRSIHSKEIVSKKSRFIKKKVHKEYFNDGKLQSKKITRNKETPTVKKMRKSAFNLTRKKERAIVK